MLTNDASDASGASPEPQLEQGGEAALNKPEIEKLIKKISSSRFQDFMKSKGFGDRSKDINYQKFKDEFPELVKVKEEDAAFSVFEVGEEGYLVVLTAGYYWVRQDRLPYRSRDKYNIKKDGEIGRTVEHIRKLPGGAKRYSDGSRAGAYTSGSYKEVKPAFLINKDGGVTKHVYYTHVLDTKGKEAFEKEAEVLESYIKSKGHVGIVRHVAGDSFDHHSRGTLQKVTGVQPYLGDSLQDYMEKKIINDKEFKFDFNFLKDLFKKVVKELKFLDGYVHGDLTPANMTFKEGIRGEGEVGLIDFGFAEEVESEFDLDTYHWSGCKYFDPFRLNGYCAASDVFTLAFVMLTYHSSFFNEEAKKFLTYICLKLRADMDQKAINNLIISYSKSDDELIGKKLDESIDSIKHYRKLAPNPMYKKVFNYLSISDVKALEGVKLKIAASLCEEVGFNPSVLGNISRLKDDKLKIAASLCKEDGFNSSVLGNISSLKDDNLKIAALLCEKVDFNSSALDGISRLKDDNLKIAVSLCEKVGFNSSALDGISRLKDDNLKIAALLCEKVGFNSSVLGNISSLGGDKLAIAISLLGETGFNLDVLGIVENLDRRKLVIAGLLCKEDGFNLENLTEISNLDDGRSAIAASLCEEDGFNSSALDRISRLEGDKLEIAASLCKEDDFNSSALDGISRLGGDKLKIAASLCKEDDFNREVFNKIANLEDDDLKTGLASLCELIRALGEYCKREDRHPAKNSAATEFQDKLKSMMVKFISQGDLSTTELEKMLKDLVKELDSETKNALFTNSICEFSLSFWKINVSMRSWECSTLGGLLSHFKIFSDENKRLEHAVSDYDYHNRMLNDPNDPNDPNDYFSTEESFGRWP